MHDPHGQNPDRPGWSRRVLLLCFAVVAIDGADIGVYGAALPSILRYEPWAATPALAGAIGSYTLFGLLSGALLSGYITDRFGRRRPIITYTILFSVLTMACAAAPDLTTFAVLRFFVGLALGGVLPMSIALALEFAPPQRRNTFNATAQLGYPVGTIFVTLLALVILPSLGFHALFLTIGACGLALVPLLLWKLPESPQFLMAAGRTAQAIALAAQAGVQIDTTRGATPARSRTSVLQLLRVLFSAQFRRVTIVLPAVGFFGVLLAYGLSTWLPELLRQSGYSLGSALTFLLALNVGQIIGQLTLSRLADRFGARTTIATAFAGAGLCVLAISTGLPGAAVFALVLAAGFGALTSQSLLFGYAGMLYPAAVRGSGLGWVMGLSRVGGICGPIVGAFLLSGYGISASFYGFAAAAVAAAAVLLLAPRRIVAAEDAPAPAAADPAPAES